MSTQMRLQDAGSSEAGVCRHYVVFTMKKQSHHLLVLLVYYVIKAKKQS